MHTLYVTSSPDGKGHMRAVKAVRAASQYLNTPLGLREAKKVADVAADVGYARVGETESVLSMERAVYEIGTVSDGTLIPHTDPDPQELHRSTEAVREEPAEQPQEDEAPTEDRIATHEGYEVALVLLGTASGRAAEVMTAALNLKKVTGDPVYDEALVAISRAYPFVGEVLKQNGLWPA